jgi:hypothetical protein
LQGSGPCPHQQNERDAHASAAAAAEGSSFDESDRPPARRIGRAARAVVAIEFGSHAVPFRIFGLGTVSGVKTVGILLGPIATTAAAGRS